MKKDKSAMVRLIGFRDLAAIATGVSLAEGARR